MPTGRNREHITALAITALTAERQFRALLDYFRTSPAEFQAGDPEILAQIAHS